MTLSKENKLKTPGMSKINNFLIQNDLRGYQMRMKVYCKNALQIQACSRSKLKSEYEKLNLDHLHKDYMSANLEIL